MQVLAIADDTTGALEVGAKLAGQGVRALVTTRLTDWPDAPALVVDTQSRQLEPAHARERVTAVAMAAREAGVPYLYKKTDSTMRGNIASEFEALMDVFPERRVVWVPAYPAMGRVVINGELYVDGMPLGQTAVAPGAVMVCDGRTDDDLRAEAAALARDVKPSIAAGAAGFAEFWARALPLERGWVAPRPRVKCCLVLSGSRHPASMEQIRQGAAAGIATFYLGEDPVFASGWVALATPGNCPEGVSERIGAMARCARDGLVVFGGATAFAALQALGVSVVESCGELLPGIPLSLIRLGGREVALVTKAGGFGAPDTLLSIRQRLENRP